MVKMNYVILPDKDLSPSQIYVTKQTYDRFAQKFAERKEWNKKTIKEITKYNLKPFVKHAKKNGNILIVSCQTGRDYSLLTKKGFHCLGVGFSYGLLTEAVKRVPDGLFVRLDLKALPFMPESFEAIYADALMHNPKRQMGELLKDFNIFLKDKGVLYLSVRLGSASVIMMDDLGGKRYVTLYRKDEVLSLIKTAGFKLLWSAVSLHTDPKLPGWFSLMAQKL